MNIEYEAMFPNVDKEEMRERLKIAGAFLVRPEYLQKRIPFYLPKEKRTDSTWLRVRDEGNKITLSLKSVDGSGIEGQKEICLEVSDFNDMVSMLELIGCEPKSYQETKRELWKLNNVEITIDEWPFLEPFVEVEGESENEVKEVSERLGFKYSDAIFDNVAKLYSVKYGISQDEIIKIPKILFDMENPFIKFSPDK